MRVAADVGQLMREGRSIEEYTHVVNARFGDGAIFDVCGEIPTKVAVARVERDIP